MLWLGCVFISGAMVSQHEMRPLPPLGVPKHRLYWHAGFPQPSCRVQYFDESRKALKAQSEAADDDKPVGKQHQAAGQRMPDTAPAASEAVPQSVSADVLA